MPGCAGSRRGRRTSRSSSPARSAAPSRDAVVATGLLDDFGVALAAADFALCPIEFGGGTKIKLLEGLAAGLPTVAFAEALHGLDLDGEVLAAPKSEHGLLACAGPAVGSCARP